MMRNFDVHSQSGPIYSTWKEKRINKTKLTAKILMYLQSIRQRVDERVFFPETSGTTRSSQDYNCTNSSHGRYYCQPQLQNTDDNNTKPQQHFFVLGNDFRSIKIEKENETQKPLRHFFEEWPPKSTDSWLDLASTSSRLGNDQLKPQ
ncbi:hypothetical protein HS088_TW07G01144 [Tripterygium wilfordii]|uniref:Uncharacterized protein n=1 Tax=Tripterygium wilfordii TaxID=458696 RepID=A0A7J7DGT2_TRIWF|nr:hypothetical protein HS088_TW07G01144 [Tripterygium wilfordii]